MTRRLLKLYGQTAPTWLTFTSLALLAVTAPMTFRGPPLVLWNASASVPVGLYLVQSGAHLHRGDFAVSELPTSVRQLAADRKYLPLGVLLVKPVAATFGSKVCRQGEALFVDDVWTAEAKTSDRRNRPLPVWSGCLTLSHDQVLLANPNVRDSFDGRYFGPTDSALLHGRAWPLLTFPSKPAA